MLTVTYSLLTDDALLNHIDEISAIRIKTFKEFPYLHQINSDYEKKYLGGFVRTPDSFIMSAKISNVLVGFITAIPLATKMQMFVDMQTKVSQNNLDIEKFYYIGEAIITSKYRGQSICSQLSKLAEAEIIRRNYSYSSFATVIRPDAHPLRPKNYSNPNKIFKHLGYTKSTIRFTMEWPTTISDGSIKEQSNPMAFWFKQFVN